MQPDKSSPKQHQTDGLLTAKELCQRFGVSRDWVYKRTKSGAIDPLPHVRLGNLVRFDLREVKDFLSTRHRVGLGGRIISDDGIARVKGRSYRTMARKRFQAGHVRLRGKRDPYWEGFYREDVLLPDGRAVRRQRTKNLGRKADIPTKKLAQRKLADVVAELNDLDYRPRPVATVREFVEKTYLNVVFPLRKGETQRGYKVVLQKHILPDLGDRLLADVTDEGIQALLNRKSARGLSWNTVKNIRVVLSSVFQAAVKYQYRKSNPVRSTELPPEPVRVFPPLPTDQDLDRLEDALAEPYRTMVWLARTTGLRVSELLALCWRAVDWKQKRLWVRQAFYDGRFDSPKTHRSQRPVGLMEDELQRLAEFRLRTPETTEDDWLFPNKRGNGPLQARNVLRRVIQPTARKLGIPHVTWHLLRHWNSTMMHEEGVPLKVAQERLGHARAETTMRHYVHASQQAAQEAAEAISRRMQASRERGLWPKNVSGSVSELEKVSA